VGAGHHAHEATHVSPWHMMSPDCEVVTRSRFIGTIAVTDSRPRLDTSCLVDTKLSSVGKYFSIWLLADTTPLHASRLPSCMRLATASVMPLQLLLAITHVLGCLLPLQLRADDSVGHIPGGSHLTCGHVGIQGGWVRSGAVQDRHAEGG
jgi:hypothetical protein